ncbi:MAG TPA: hypothetical protein VIK45_00260 [Candidatus Dormibacteraeota bacterium]
MSSLTRTGPSVGPGGASAGNSKTASAAWSVKTTPWPPFERALDSTLVTLTADDVVFR